MRKSLSVLIMVVAAISICSAAYAFDGKGRGHRALKQDVLSQLPPEKEMLFRQTMREAREETAENRGEIEKLKKEMVDILTAPVFDERLFLEKRKSLQILRQENRQAIDERLAGLATGLSQEERIILAKLIPEKYRQHKRHGTRSYK
jgi:uncharacterized membrane protein